MIYIANWAKHHIAAARLLIALLHVCISITAIQLSQQLENAGIFFFLNQAFPLALTGFCIIVVAGFIRKNTVSRISKKRLQRLRFFLMGICCTLLLVGYFSSQSISEYPVSTKVLAAFTNTEKSEKPTLESYSDKESFYKDLKAYYYTLSKKELRKELHQQLEKASHISSDGETAILIILLGVILSVAISLIVALSCQLACNGQGALSWLVFIGGIGGIILLLVILGKKYRKHAKNKKVEEQKQKAEKQKEANQSLILEKDV